MTKPSSDHELGAAATKKHKFLSAAWEHYDCVPNPGNSEHEFYSDEGDAICNTGKRQYRLQARRRRLRATSAAARTTLAFSGSSYPTSNLYFDKFANIQKHLEVTRKSEIEEYLNKPRVKVKPADEKNFHNLDWWNTAQSKYPNLSRMARDILTIPVSSVASESVSTNWIFYYFGVLDDS
ncbi:hypothetical protein PsorP6_002719 [Peronosclerospora sorghi]|uniref:Uncharacterized protein n=1 Tax=Peronosclerospora sorghi TaxID=230839 RepID=A0ACC0WUB6_9STRA|nr:hypothetical protein PsorP6_002719 [Peronosclerospora sorghi]